jgi:uncharacterized protein involved in exopolysaccharide biosynthesis
MSTPPFMSVSRSTNWPWVIRRNIRVVTSRFALFALITVVALISAVAVDQMYPKTYTSVTRLVTEPATARTPPFDSPLAPMVNEIEFMQTQVEIVKSGRVMGKVAQDLNLSSHVDDLSTPVDQLSFAVEGVETWTGLKPALKDQATAQRLRAIDLLTHRVTPRVVRDTFVLEVAVSTRNAKLSQQIATAVVATYQQVSSEARLQHMKASDKVLTDQVSEAAKRVKDAEGRLAAFDVEKGTTVSTTTANTTGALGNLPSTTTTVIESRARLDRMNLEAALSAERTRLATLNTQLDSLKVSEAAVETRTAPTDLLDSPALAIAPDGLGLKYKVLIFILVAPVIGVLACYAAQLMQDYRRELAPARAS